MTLEEYDALQSELVLLRREQVQSSYGLIPKSIQYLEKRLLASESDGEQAELYSLLISECSTAKNDRLYLDWLRRRVLDRPTDPICYAGLAFTLAMFGSEPRDEAMAASVKALNLAKSQDRLIRYCATNLARVALILDDCDALNLALEVLIADAGKKRSEDAPYQFDFIDQIKSSRCDASLLARYKELKFPP